MATLEDGLEICNQLNIAPSQVMSIDIFVAYRTLIVKTTTGEIKCSLVPDESVGKLAFHIVREEPWWDGVG